MSAPSLAAVSRQIQGVRRRLLIQSLINHLIWCIAGALLLAALWLVVSPYIVGLQSGWLRWVIVGGAFVFGGMTALVWTWRRAPSPLDAALQLDNRFHLNERVTTTLTLTEEQAASPAGQALLADVGTHVNSLQVGSQFPLQVSWKKTLFPIVAACLVILAMFFEPDLRSNDASASPDADVASLEEQKKDEEIKKLFEMLDKEKKKLKVKSPEYKEIEADWERLVKADVNPKNEDELREKAQKIRELEEKINERMQQLLKEKQKQEALEKQMQQMKNIAPDQGQGKKGPADKMMQALKKGDVDKAQQEMQKLEQKLRDNKLNDKEKKDLEQQMEQMEQRMQDQAKKNQEQKEQLEQQLKQGNDQQKQEAKQKLDQMKKMEQMQKQAGECKKCLQQGDGKKAADQMKNMAKQMQNMAGDQKDVKKDLDKLKQADQERKQLEQDAQKLRDARQKLAQRLDPQNANAGGKGGGLRPKGKVEDTDNIDARQDLEIDTAGKLKLLGFERGGSFKRIPAQEVAGTLRRTAQEAQRAIETQRIAPDDAEVLKGYYRNLGGQKER